MSEKISSGYDDVEAEAERLRQRHTAWSEGLEAAEDVNQRAKDLGDRIAESSDPENEFSYQERLFANGQLQQNDMLHHAKLHYNANLWEARQHYYDNQEAYFDLAKREAEAVTTFYESYFGVCDIYSPVEAKAMAAGWSSPTASIRPYFARVASTRRLRSSGSVTDPVTPTPLRDLASDSAALAWGVGAGVVAHGIPVGQRGLARVG